MQFLKNYSNRELNIWAELVLDLIISIYFFPKLFLLIISGDIYSNESIIFNPLSNHYVFTPTLISALLIIITLFCSAGKSVSLLYFYRRSI